MAGVGGFLVSVKGIAIAIYAIMFGSMVKKQLAKALYRKS
jgi:hypothetical protein